MSDAAAPRLRSLDAFRGLTVAAMLLVNNPGTWSAIYPPLRHAAWHGWTPTDLIFPFFLFIVGVTTELAPKRPLRILRRGLLIIAIGLLLNAFPRFDLATLRWTGVLQRIGVVYVAAALIATFAGARPFRRTGEDHDESQPSEIVSSRRQHARQTVTGTIVVALLSGYWLVLAQGPLEPAEATVAAQVDRMLIPESHMWSQSRTWDPEGVLSTLPAIATALLGVMAATLVKRKEVAKLMIAGAALSAAGWLWGLAFPINKPLWTSSYVLLTAGLAAMSLALCIFLIDVRGVWKGSAFVTFGINPIAAFVGSGLLAKLLGLIKIDGVSLQALSYRLFFKPYFTPQLASVLWALTFVLVWYAILRLMQWRGIVLRV